MPQLGANPGDRVLARWEGGPFFFVGTVHSAAADTLAIAYDDGTTEIRPMADVQPFDWAVGTRIEAQWSGNGQYYEARITKISPDGREIDVRFDDGIRETVPSGYCRQMSPR